MVSVKPLAKAPDVISRRQLLLSIASSLLLPGAALASVAAREKLSWSAFQAQMTALADAETRGIVKREAVANLGLQKLQQLDIHSAEFSDAVEESYESGNRYWLWQRLMKHQNINGGILNIDDEQMVQLHDHPGAIGMVRIISGEVEVWQFDEVKKNGADEPQSDEKQSDEKQGVAELAAELVLVSRTILRPGDTAVLTPDRGNIHALRSVSKECRMLDFFIPPYEISQRSWFEPLVENWFDRESLSCRKIPQHAYTKA